MPKTHLYLSNEPLKRGTNVKAHCGATVRNVDFRFQAEGDITAIDVVKNIGNCQKCMEARFSKRYLYGICEGQLLKDDEPTIQIKDQDAAQANGVDPYQTDEAAAGTSEG